MTANKHFALEDALPFWHLESDGLMVYRDGSLGCGFKLEGADISCLENQGVNDLATKLENLLTSTGEGIKLQFVCHLSSSVGGLIDGHQGISQNAPAKYAPLRNSRPRDLRRRVVSGGIFSLDIFCFVRGTPHGFGKRRFWESPKKFERITKSEFGEHKNRFLRTKKQIQSSLEYAGLGPQNLASKQWFEILFRFFNLERSEKLKVPHFDPVADFSSQLVLSDFHIHKDYLQAGKYLFRTLTLKSLPEGESYASMVEGFLKSLPFHSGRPKTLRF